MRIAIALLCVGAGLAHAQVPDRQIPPSVLAEVRMLDNQFDLSLSADCDESRCFSKGCTYVAHATADRPASTSLPGLGLDPGPGSVPAQEYLTRARCTFAYEESVESDDAKKLARRLRNKLSTGWVVVDVTTQRLQPLPQYLQEPPAPEMPEEAEEAALAEEEPPVAPPVETWSFGVAARELWVALLPHFFWMIGVTLLTMAGAALIWAWRRVGRESLEDRMLLAEMEANARQEGSSDAGSEDQEAEELAFIAEQEAAWAERLGQTDPEGPAPEVRALVSELLRTGDLPLLAKAMLKFPDTLPAAFPATGGFATVKLELADYLKEVDAADLPGDADFYRQLNRSAMAAAITAQRDAQVVLSLREGFGPAGITSLIPAMGDRAGALLFALAPSDAQHEVVRLLEPILLVELARKLLQSNRMSPRETAYLVEVLESARAEEPIPPAPPEEVSDLGEPFDATGALSVLLENLDPARRRSLFREAMERFHGSLPAWYRGILVADMLLELPDEARADLLLEIDLQPLVAWFSTLDAYTQRQLLTGMPRALVGSIESVPTGQLAHPFVLAERGRRQIARGLQSQLARIKRTFETLVAPRFESQP